jgi:hypothetical protein
VVCLRVITASPEFRNDLLKSLFELANFEFRFAISRFLRNFLILCCVKIIHWKQNKRIINLTGYSFHLRVLNIGSVPRNLYVVLQSASRWHDTRTNPKLLSGEESGKTEVNAAVTNVELSP